MGRIAHVTCDPGVRTGAQKGAAVHLAAMRTAFRELGFEVEAIDARDDHTARARLEALHAVRPLQLVYERLALRASAVSDFARERDLPHVVEVNAPLDEEEARYRGGRTDAHLMEQLSATLSGAELVLAVSTPVAEWATKHGARPLNVHVEPNGVDSTLFHPSLRAEGRARIGVAGDTFVVGFHGRLRPWHRIGRIGSAVASLRRSGIDAMLVTLGHGDFEAELAPVLAAEARRSIDWVPHEDVGPIVAAFDALPLAYDVDSPCYFSPLKLREAMAAGVVPVVPDLGDLVREIDGGAAGLVFDASRPSALFEALSALHRDQGRREELQRAAIRVGVAQSWTGIALRVVERLGVVA